MKQLFNIGDKVIFNDEYKKLVYDIRGWQKVIDVQPRYNEYARIRDEDGLMRMLSSTKNKEIVSYLVTVVDLETNITKTVDQSWLWKINLK